MRTVRSYFSWNLAVLSAPFSGEIADGNSCLGPPRVSDSGPAPADGLLRYDPGIGPAALLNVAGEPA